MAIPSPTIPSSITATSAVRLNPTQNNKSFYVYSGLQGVTTSETTLISINDIGKRDIFIAFEIGSDEATSVDSFVRIKVNGETVIGNRLNNNYQAYAYGFDELRMIVPANTSLEVTIEMDSGGTIPHYVSGYGTYLEHSA